MNSQAEMYIGNAEQLTLFSEALPASPSALRDAAELLVTNVISGRLSCGLYAKLDQDGLWRKIRQGFSQLKDSLAMSASGLRGSSSGRSCARLPRWGIAVDGVCGVPVTWVRRTNGKGCSSWPTVKASDGYHGGPNSRGSKGNPDLCAAVLWATPAAQDGKNATLPQSQADRDTLPGHVISNLWATPNVPNGGRVNPPEMSPTGRMPDGSKRQVGLEEQVKTAGRLSGYCLNADWTEQLMGLPIGFTGPYGRPDVVVINTRGSRRASSPAGRRRDGPNG